MEISTRTEAAKKGMTKYFTGVPCGKGHSSPRYVVSGNCCQCAKESNRKFKALQYAARFGDNTVEYKRRVSADLVETLDAVITAYKGSR